MAITSSWLKGVPSPVSKLRRVDTWQSGDGYWGRRVDALLGRYLTPTVVLSDSVVASRSAEKAIRDAVGKICAGFDDAYWLERDRTATFPDAFFAAMAGGNWLGIAMPEAYGGAGLGITDPYGKDVADPAEVSP